MTTRTLNIRIQSGIETCAAEYGVFCEHTGSRKFGQKPVCMLTHEDLDEVTGWVMRSQWCKDMEYV
jgi:hypothetical protein